MLPDPSIAQYLFDLEQSVCGQVGVYAVPVHIVRADDFIEPVLQLIAVPVPNL